MSRKLMNLNQYISVVTDMDKKWFVVFEHTINRLFLFMFVYPNLNTITIFPVLHLFFFLFFLFLLLLSTFKSLNALYLKFEPLKTSGRTFVQQKLGAPGWRSPSIGSSKILNFLTLRARWIKLLKTVDIKKKLNLTKIGGATMGVPPQKCLLKFILFNL